MHWVDIFLDKPLFGEDVARGLLKLISGSSDLLILASTEIESNWFDVSKSVKSKRQDEKMWKQAWLIFLIDGMN